MTDLDVSIGIKKALKSTCQHKVACVIFNSKGDILGTSVNKHNGYGRGLSHHAEIEAIKKFGRSINSILLCRVNKSGDLLPIEPCNTCRKMLEKYNIKVRTIKQGD
jgi:cytidine deaminase